MDAIPLAWRFIVSSRTFCSAFPGHTLFPDDVNAFREQATAAAVVADAVCANHSLT